MKKRIFTNEEIEIMKSFYEQGISCQDIAYHLKCHSNTVRKNMDVYIPEWNRYNEINSGIHLLSTYQKFPFNPKNFREK